MGKRVTDAETSAAAPSSEPPGIPSGPPMRRGSTAAQDADQPQEQLQQQPQEQQHPDQQLGQQMGEQQPAPELPSSNAAYPRLTLAVREGQRWWPHLASVSLAARAARAAANAAALAALEREAVQLEEADAGVGAVGRAGQPAACQGGQGPALRAAGATARRARPAAGCPDTSALTSRASGAGANADADAEVAADVVAGGLAGRRRGLAAAAVPAPAQEQTLSRGRRPGEPAKRLKLQPAPSHSNVGGDAGSSAAGALAAAPAAAAVAPGLKPSALDAGATQGCMLSARCRPAVWLPGGRPAAGLSHPPLRDYLVGAGSHTASAVCGAIRGGGGGGGSVGSDAGLSAAAPAAAGRRQRFAALRGGPAAAPTSPRATAAEMGTGPAAAAPTAAPGAGGPAAGCGQGARAAELALLRCPHPGWAVRATAGDAGGDAGRYWWPGVLTARRLGTGVTSLPLEQPYMAAWFRSLLSSGAGAKAPQQCQVRVQVELDGVLLLQDTAAPLQQPHQQPPPHQQHKQRQKPQGPLVFEALLKRSRDVPSGGRVFGVPPELLAGRYVRGWRREMGRRSTANQGGGGGSPVGTGPLEQEAGSRPPEPEGRLASRREEQPGASRKGGSASAAGARPADAAAAAAAGAAAPAGAAMGGSRGGLRRRQSAPADLDPNSGSSRVPPPPLPPAAAAATSRRAGLRGTLPDAATLVAPAPATSQAATSPSGEGRPRRATSIKRPRWDSEAEARNAAGSMGASEPVPPAARERGPGTVLLTLVLSTHNPTKIV
ncbi:hypothetical protein HXX76_012306 [Chlamydomonas incerta]|uniref:Uncharacterized protein n=1 Tax=Chlamydomonas incerta TaxID=51695 RepID=A0A835SI91_CHLIN|nr:hypothetical protein HXX76_012306 [Chlamydomonas incerta]|eukprot:KAG2427657.1 hypothetical protein HXX76_012306 [Chlamydomonas incerta]